MIQGANKSGSLIYDINECNAMDTRLSVPNATPRKKSPGSTRAFFNLHAPAQAIDLIAAESRLLWRAALFL